MAVTKRLLPDDPEWLKLAWADEGQKEIKGSRDNPLIVQYFKDVGHGWVKDDETAWCAAYVGSCLERADMPHTGALNARSYLKWGSSTKEPKRGDIVVFKRGNSSWQGHVAFYIGEANGRIYYLGGNQRNMVNVMSRSKHSSTILGYRTPTAPSTSRTYKAAAVGGTAGMMTLVAESTEVISEAQAGFEMTGTEWGIMAAGLLGVACAAVVIYARWDDWRRKGR